MRTRGYVSEEVFPWAGILDALANLVGEVEVQV